MKVEKYNERNWAIYDTQGDLICITVYKKGALEVARRLENSPAVGKPIGTKVVDMRKLVKELQTVTKQLNSLLQI